MGLFGPPNVEKMKAQKDVKELINILGYQKDANVRQAAAEALGEIGDARAVEPLIGSLNDENEDVRQAATESLGLIGEPAIKPLVAFIEHTRNTPIADLKFDPFVVRPHAATALGMTGDSLAVEPLVAVLNGSSLDSEKMAAVSGLCTMQVVEPLIVALDPYDSKMLPVDVRCSAALALGKIGDARAVEPLIATLKDKDVRQNAIHALGQIGDARAIEPLIALFSRRDKVGLDVRRLAAEALVRIYHQKTLDEESKKRIMAVRKKIIKKHHDLGGGCEVAHSDNRAIDVDFPL